MLHEADRCSFCKLLLLLVFHSDMKTYKIQLIIKLMLQQVAAPEASLGLGSPPTESPYLAFLESPFQLGEPPRSASLASRANDLAGAGGGSPHGGFGGGAAAMWAEPSPRPVPPPNPFAMESQGSLSPQVRQDAACPSGALRIACYRSACRRVATLSTVPAAAGLALWHDASLRTRACAPTEFTAMLRNSDIIGQ